jgi:hypothetical protein
MCIYSSSEMSRSNFEEAFWLPCTALVLPPLFTPPIQCGRGDASLFTHILSYPQSSPLAPPSRASLISIDLFSHLHIGHRFPPPSLLLSFSRRELGAEIHCLQNTSRGCVLVFILPYDNHNFSCAPLCRVPKHPERVPQGIRTRTAHAVHLPYTPISQQARATD